MQVTDYFPYGGTNVDEKYGSFAQPYTYTGKELDSEVDLYYYGARYYNAGFSRFTSVDPTARFITNGRYFIDPQLWNSYGYARNNPLNYIDENGKFAIAITIPLIEMAVEAATILTYYYLKITEDLNEIEYIPSTTEPTETTTTVPSISEEDKNTTTTIPDDTVEKKEPYVTTPAEDVYATSILETPEADVEELEVHYVESKALPDVNNLDQHIINSMKKRDWTINEILEAYEYGEQYSTVDKTSNNEPATRYVHPTTGKSEVINDNTGKIIHVGDEDFKYD